MQRALLPAALVLTIAPVHAAEKPTAVVPRMRVSADTSDAFRTRYDARLRAELETHVTILGPKATKKALAAAGSDADHCADAGCAQALTKSSGARFAVLGMVANDAEIFTITVAVYDAAKAQTTATVKAVCELCGVSEVEDQIAHAMKQVEGALTAAVPEKPAPTPAGTFVEVRTEPPGAQISIDGEKIGASPIKHAVPIGVHVVLIQKEGYDDERREIRVSEGTFRVGLALKVQAETTTPVTQPREETVATSPSYAGWGWGLTLGGAVATGVGAWLIILDGTTNCDSKGRRECPNVYDTKAGGMGAFGLGAAAMGVGIALLALDPGGVPVGDGAGTVEPVAEGGALFRYTVVF